LSKYSCITLYVRAIQGKCPDIVYGLVTGIATKDYQEWPNICHNMSIPLSR
jgi:hypothetical protein